MLIDGDGEWDALLVERDTPVMDGFRIASALRDFEKARRNRASTVRAAAVEGHAIGVGGATIRGHGLEWDPGGNTRPKQRVQHLRQSNRRKRLLSNNADQLLLSHQQA